MRLVSLSIKNLYGSLTRKILFNEELNLLVGINGSGKTSILNVIDWLLRPNLAELAISEFESLSLEFSYENEKVVLEAAQVKQTLILSLKGLSSGALAPIKVNLLVPPNEINRSSDTEQLVEMYSRLSPEKKEIPLWEYLRRLPKPTVITLDRTITADADDEHYVEREPTGRVRRRKRSSVNPLEKVRDVTAIHYAQYRSKLIELNDELKAKIVMSALSDGVQNKKSKRLPTKITPEELTNLEAKVSSYLSTVIRGENPAAQIRAFFKRVQVLVEKSAHLEAKTDQRFVWSIFSRQYLQIEALAQAFNEFEINSKESYARLERYFSQLNGFFIDSRKEIFFDEKINEISCRFVDAKGVPEDKVRSIDCLSSGERQILILLTFLEFVADSKRIFIVDEPELSLHPKWQRDFLKAFLALKPKATQVLLATHSPEIVGKRKDSCIVIAP